MKVETKSNNNKEAFSNSCNTNHYALSLCFSLKIPCVTEPTYENWRMGMFQRISQYSIGQINNPILTYL
jgi:hypothetical protein